MGNDMNADAIVDRIDDLLTYMACCKPERNHPLLRADFDGAMPVNCGLDDIEGGWAVSAYAHPWSWAEYARHFPDEARVSIIQPFEREAGDTYDYKAAGWNDHMFVSYEILSRSSKLYRLSPMKRHYLVDLRFAAMLTNGKYKCLQRYMGWNGTSWDAHEDPADRELSQMTAMATGIAQMRPFWWMVHLGYESTPTIAFRTDPVGARAAFRLRDIPNGASRRAALVHWVREHWRKTDREDGESTRVRRHMRGAESFAWNGLRCKIVPSRADQLIAKGELKSKPAIERLRTYGLDGSPVWREERRDRDGA